jgi:hypothetical protein
MEAIVSASINNETPEAVVCEVRMGEKKLTERKEPSQSGIQSRDFVNLQTPGL